MLNEIAARPFFSMADVDEPSELIMDDGAGQIRVELTDTTRSVTAFASGDPPSAFGVLEAYLPRTAEAQWPAEAIDGVRLSEAAGGVLVAGEALRTAWASPRSDRRSPEPEGVCGCDHE